MDTRVCGTAVEMQTLADAKTEKKGPNSGQGADTTPSTTLGITTSWGQREGVKDEIMNTKGPDKQTTTLYSATGRVEATAQKNSLKKHP